MMIIITLNSDKSYNYNYNYDVKMMKIVFVPILIKKTNNEANKKRSEKKNIFRIEDFQYEKGQLTVI